jgi:hypothetical protein
MERSEVYVDTVVKTNLRVNGKTIFNYLDSSYSDTLNIRKFFSKKYDLLLQDTVEYLFVANLTNKPISFKKLNNQLVAEEFGKYENFGFKPLSFFIYPKCGTGIDYADLVLQPKEILIIKSLTKRRKSVVQGQPNCFMKLLIGSEIVLVSTLYRKPIGNNDFYINSEFEKDFNYIKHRLAFKNR